MQPNSNDPYGFIMNSPAKAPRQPIGTGARIAVVAGGVLLLLIVAVIGSTVLSSGDKAQTQKYLEITQHQTEIVRLSAIADKKAKGIHARSYAVTTRLSVESAQKNTNAILAKHGYKDKKLNKVIGGAKNTKSDAILDEADKNNRFDEAYLKLINAELVNYQKLLNDASAGASKSEKVGLLRAYKQVNTLKKSSANPTTPLEQQKPPSDSTDDSADTTGPADATSILDDTTN